MPDYVTLLGAEDVQRAARQMQSAADDMQRAASQIDHSLTIFARQMEGWVSRLEALVPIEPDDFGHGPNSVDPADRQDMEG